MPVEGHEIHSIIENIFGDVHGLNVSSQLQVNCPRCMQEAGLSYPDMKFNLEISTRYNRLLYRCWSCEPQFSGNLGKLIRQYGTKADYELYKSLVSIYQVYEHNGDEEDEIEYAPIKLPNEMIYFSNMNVLDTEHFEAYNYMVNERKISRDDLIKYKVGFCTTGRFKQRIIIPSYDESGIINYFVSRYYGTDKTVKNKYMNPFADKDKIIFNSGLINWDSTCYICEGVFDALSLPNSIPLLGKTLSSSLYVKLKEIKPNIIILLDPDAHRNAIDLFFQLNTIYVDCEERVRIVKLTGKDDVDKIRRDRGVGEVIHQLYQARGLSVDDLFLKKLDSNYGQSRRRYSIDSKYNNGESSFRKSII